MEELVLTRYLFSYDEVKHSLFIEILDGNVGAALYWGYELYWSGYEEDTFEWLLKTYDLMFELDEEFKKRITAVDNITSNRIGTVSTNHFQLIAVDILNTVESTAVRYDHKFVGI